MVRLEADLVRKGMYDAYKNSGDKLHITCTLLNQKNFAKLRFGLLKAAK